MARLQIPRPYACGILELLWHFTARLTPQGNVGKYGDFTIAEAVSWPGDPAVLVAALTASGYLDVSQKHRLVVHDWHEHADEATKKALARKGLTFVTADRKVSRQRRTTADNGGQNLPAVAVAVAVALPEPKPEPERRPPPSASLVAVEPSWSNEAVNAWTESKGGPPPKAIFGALKAAVTAHGWERVSPVWRFYLDATPGEFVNAAKFVAAFGEWEKRSKGWQGPGAVKQTPGNATLAAAARVMERHGGRQ